MNFLKVLARFVIGGSILNVVVAPMLFGKEKSPWGYADFIRYCFELVTMTAICGRILEWW